ncbi:MAG: hypothetical protein HFJ75_07685 [Eggerthellaceae bacterium]|nr:hypothetical protein [Eggerthellaceae bacterium]
MHPQDRAVRAKQMIEGLEEIILALIESPDPCERSLVVLHEIAIIAGDELAPVVESLDPSVHNVA